MPKRALVLICTLMFMFAVIEHSYKSWFPIFCLMMNYLTKEEAAFIVSVMAIIMIVERFLNIDVVKVLSISSIVDIGLFSSAILAYFMGFSFYLVYGTALIFALFNSLQYSSYYSLPTYFKYKVRIQDGTKFIMSYAIGETILVTLTGYLMKYIHPIALHFYLLLICIITRFAYISAVTELSKR